MTSEVENHNSMQSLTRSQISEPNQLPTCEEFDEMKNTPVSRSSPDKTIQKRFKQMVYPSLKQFSSNLFSENQNVSMVKQEVCPKETHQCFQYSPKKNHQNSISKGQQGSQNLLRQHNLEQQQTWERAKQATEEQHSYIVPAETQRNQNSGRKLSTLLNKTPQKRLLLKSSSTSTNIQFQNGNPRSQNIPEFQKKIQTIQTKAVVTQRKSTTNEHSGRNQNQKSEEKRQLREPYSGNYYSPQKGILLAKTQICTPKKEKFQMVVTTDLKTESISTSEIQDTQNQKDTVSLKESTFTLPEMGIQDDEKTPVKREGQLHQHIALHQAISPPKSIHMPIFHDKKTFGSKEDDVFFNAATTYHQQPRHSVMVQSKPERMHSELIGLAAANERRQNQKATTMQMEDGKRVPNFEEDYEQSLKPPHVTERSNSTAFKVIFDEVIGNFRE